MVTLAQAKEHLRVTHDADDAAIALMIDGAYATLEGRHGLTQRSFRLQEHVRQVDAWGGLVRLPYPPIVSVDAVTYRGEGGAVVTIPADDYRLDTVAGDGLAYLRCEGAGPGPDLDTRYPISIAYTAGYEAVPSDVQGAVLLLVGHAYENREAVTDGPARELPMGVQAVADRYRVY